MNAIQWTACPASSLGAARQLQAQWDALNAARLDLSFLSSGTVAAAIDIFGDGTERLLVGTSGGQPVAMLVIANDGFLRWSTFQPSQLPLGAWVAASGWQLADLARSLARSGCLGRLGPCLALSLTQVDPHMQARLEDADDLVHGDFVETAWLPVQGRFEDFWAARGKNLRQNMRKQRNKLAADGTVTELRMLTAPEDVPAAIARYGDMESKGWKAAQGTAIHPDNAQGRFYTRILEEGARRGETIIFEYLFNGQTVAMDLGQRHGEVLVVLKTTYDETIPKTLSPAALLREDALRHIFDESTIRRIEYYGRVMEWHTKLTDQKRMLYHITCYRWPMLKQLAERRRRAAASRELARQERTPPVEQGAVEPA